MMIHVNRHKDTITGSFNGKPYTVQYTDGRYHAMKALEKRAAKAQSLEELRRVMNEFSPYTIDNDPYLITEMEPGKFLFINEEGQFFLKLPSADDASSEYMPGPLVERIIRSAEKKIDFTPIVKCWTRFLRNPNYTRDKAEHFGNYLNISYTNQQMKQDLQTMRGMSEFLAHAAATAYQVSITTEGLINTYKVSTDITPRGGSTKYGEEYDNEIARMEVDQYSQLKSYTNIKNEDRIFEPAFQGRSGDAFWCDGKLGHILKVGHEVFLDSWGKVDTTDNDSCRPGLHVGNLDYIRGYQNSQTETHNVFIDPMDIGAITDNGDGAMRVIRYFPHSAFGGVNRAMYISSDYSELSEERFEIMIEEAIAVKSGKPLSYEEKELEQF